MSSAGGANAHQIVARGLTKHYGVVQALNDLDLTISEGEIFGFLGPNGAGKTTTIRLLLGLLRPTRGSASIAGFDVASEGTASRKMVSFLPSAGGLYEYMTAAEYLQTFCRFGGATRIRGLELAERLDLDVTRKIKNLSTGNRQKVVIVRALQNDVPVYLVDEPTRGLDPLVQQEFERIIREYRERGRTIFLSTHVLSEAEALCDRVGILRDGRLVAVETVTGLKKARVRRFSVMFDGDLPRDDELSNASFIERNGPELRFEVSGSVDSLSWLRYGSLFHYWQPVNELSSGKLNSGSALTMAAIAGLAMVTALAIFRRRDIST